MMSYICPPIDEHGKPVKRSKHKHPYSYDGFILFRLLPNTEATNTLYCDRLRSQYSNWNEMLKKHFNNISDYFHDRSPEKIQDFLRELLNKPNLLLVFGMEYCNLSNGYPVYRFEVKF